MDRLFITVLNNVLVSSWIILAVVVIRFVFKKFIKKIPKWVNCLLWGLVAIRLVFPFSIESIFSLIPSAKPVPLDIEYAKVPQIDSGITVVNSAINPILENNFAPEEIASVNPIQVVIMVASYLWVIGAIGLLIYALVSYLMLKRRVKNAQLVEKGIFKGKTIDSPFILGILRPRVYIPDSLDEEAYRCVIAHEKAHIKRGDFIWKPLGFLILSVYWFNPLSWIAYICLCKDIEYACDELVTKDKDKVWKAKYCQVLLDCSSQRPLVSACPVAFGEVSVKDRIKSVINYKKPSFWIVVISIIIAIVVAVCFLTNPKEKKFDADSALETSEKASDLIKDIPDTNAPNDSLDSKGDADETKNISTLEEAIKQAIISRGSKNAPASGANEYKVASFIKLEEVVTDGTVEIISVHGMAMYMEAEVTEDGIEETSGFHVPTILTFEVDDGEYVLTEYWEPGEGAFYGGSIKENFLPENVEIVMNSQNTNYIQTIDCYDQIIRMSGLDTDTVIEKLLNTICSSPSASSSTADYIKNWPIEYRELIYYGQYTLDYENKYTALMKDKQRQDLSLAILEEACRNIKETLIQQEEQVKNEPIERVHPITGEVKIENFVPKDIQSIEKILIVLPDNTIQTINNTAVIAKLEKMLSNAKEVKD